MPTVHLYPSVTYRPVMNAIAHLLGQKTYQTEQESGFYETIVIGSNHVRQSSEYDRIEFIFHAQMRGTVYVDKIYYYFEDDVLQGRRVEFPDGEIFTNVALALIKTFGGYLYDEGEFQIKFPEQVYDPQDLQDAIRDSHI